MKCLNCQKELPDQAMFCAGCGRKIPRCPTCKTLLTSRIRFCPKDGTPIPAEILELIPEPAPAPEKKSFCTRCGKPCPSGRKLCDACLGKADVKQSQPDKKEPGKKKKRLWPVLILILLLILGLAALGYYAVSHDLLSFPWLEDFSISSLRDGDENRDEDEAYRDRGDEDRTDDEDEDREDTAAAPSDQEGPASATEVPAEELPETEAPIEEVPATESPASAAEPDAATEATPAAEPVYLNELPYRSANGKVWTRSNEPATGTVHTNADAPDCWEDTSIPGHTHAAVRDNCSNVYTYGIHVDGSSSKKYTITYGLDGKYTRFSGYCACPESNNAISAYVYNSSTKYTKYFEIYGDGKLLFTSSAMRYDRTPQYFEVDVTGVQEMTILYPATKGPNEIATLYDGLLE